ncbi:MCP four helix bundle domain-containing protein [Stenotrophomonas rhizophila]
MDFLRNVRVVWRLGMGFGLLLLLVAAVVATGATGSAVQKHAMQQVVEVGVAKVRLLSEMLDANNQMMVVRREMLIRQGQEREADEARIAALVKRYEASWTAYRALPTDAEGKAIGEQIAARRATARPLNKQTSELMEQGDFPGAVALTLGPVQEAANGWNKALANGVAYEEKESREAAAEAIRLGERTLLQLLVLGGIALLVGIAASILIGRSLTGPLARAVGLGRPHGPWRAGPGFPPGRPRRAHPAGQRHGQRAPERAGRHHRAAADGAAARSRCDQLPDGRGRVAGRLRAHAACDQRTGGLARGRAVAHGRCDAGLRHR